MILRKELGFVFYIFKCFILFSSLTLCIQIVFLLTFDMKIGFVSCIPLSLLISAIILPIHLQLKKLKDMLNIILYYKYERIKKHEFDQEYGNKFNSAKYKAK